MHSFLARGGALWSWLLADNASRAAVLLFFVTGLYCFLTWRMAKAIALQTRAMIQPVALLDFHWEQEKFYPASFFEIKNLGSQPLLILDVKLWCSIHRKHFTEHHTLWDEHIIPPGESLSPRFDFRRQFENEKLPWSSTELAYSLEVVTSDLSKTVVLTYRNVPVLSIVNVSKGMSLSVRWRYFSKPFLQRYHRIRYRIRYGPL